MRGYGRGTAFVAMLLLVLAGGCAMQPPMTQSSFTGPRLVVTMTVQGSQELGGPGINPSYYYFFVVNYAYQLPNQPKTPMGTLAAPGPVAVFVPNGGNGFVASSDGSTNGYTDYVEYNNSLTQGNGYGLFHFVHTSQSNPQEVQPQLFGQPAQYTVPTGNQIQFTLYLTQLVENYNREHGINQTAALTLQQAQSIRYLQVNFIATNTIDPTTTSTKETDALGNNANSNYLILDFQSNNVYNNGNAPALVKEPIGDVFVTPPGSNAPDPSLDISDWSIQYFTQ